MVTPSKVHLKRIADALEKIATAMGTQKQELEEVLNGYINKSNENLKRQWLEHLRLYHPEEFEKLLQQNEKPN